MPSLYHIGKGILSIQAFPGTMMALIGAGLLHFPVAQQPFAPCVRLYKGLRRKRRFALIGAFCRGQAVLS